MNVRAVTTFLALLTVVAQVGVVAMVASQRVRDLVRPSALQIAWLVAAVSTVGSLYLSEVAHFVPCKLCWLQRIAMYPLSAVLAVAAIRKDTGVWRYTLPMTITGLVIAGYHYQLERFPAQASLGCSIDVPCTVIWVWHFHYISIPMMALSGFAAITALVLIGKHEPTT